MAGLYIHNVKLPDSAFNTLYLAVHRDGTVEYDGGPYGWKTATATPVSQHGRLGDLDELNKSFDTVLSRYDAGLIDKLTCINMLLQAFNNSTTIIPADKEDR